MVDFISFNITVPWAVNMVVLLWICCVIFILACSVNSQGTDKFPDNLLFGVASAAYQIEGAWNEEGKGESIWDRFTHENPTRIENGDNGDIACDSYHKYKEDVALAANLGVQFYRFSISWPRVLPTGYANNTNPYGIAYYQNLIDEILSYNMTPMATLYHWDLPQTIQDQIGGFNSPLLVDLFVNYSRVCFQNFPKVGYWLTFNEPRLICTIGYGEGRHAPGIPNSGIGDYQCAYVLLKAHAETYHMYKTEFANYTAKISLALDGQWSEPATNSTEDIEAAERKLEFEIGLYAHPLFIGNWPPTVIERVAQRCTLENTTNRLPSFSQAEITRINGTYDYLGFNTYFTYLVSNAPEANTSVISFDNDLRSTLSVDPSWSMGNNGRPAVSWGMRKVLLWIKNKYNNPEIMITENGVSDDGTTLQDDARISFYSDYLNALLDTIYIDDVKVVAYTAWTLMDNFEWTRGYGQHFGLHYVDFTDPNRTRTPKKSVGFFKELVASRQIPQVVIEPTNFSKKTALVYLPLLIVVNFLLLKT